MASHGYARVSTADQDPSVQLAALRVAGCTVTRAERASGARLDRRPELRTLRDLLREGDELVVTRVDHLARSIRDLQDIVHELRARGATPRATEQPIDPARVRRMRAEGVGPSEIARRLGIGRPSVYRALGAAGPAPHPPRAPHGSAQGRVPPKAPHTDTW